MKQLTQHDHIKWLLRINGSSLADIARELDICASAVTIVSKGQSRSKRVEEAIAQATNMRPEQLWPERYPDPALAV
ncbi:helix-turn-helix domain-containing protein [Aurantiacibacter zhengii]|uniref:helix-turn-helix domain-containing protein n=1 Tax=Aurantiacibacter zhengii TaxID=2307003 RepID=UPI001314810C|nr:helix-turn-helix domain-containing protein [Aurantiacibacter zhengii]